MTFELVIKGGQVIDPASGTFDRFDIGISEGRICAMDRSIPSGAAGEVIDASDSIVVPGLVDMHSHVFRGVGYFGIDPDSIASRSGVTTWVDAGSAGAFTIPGFREHVVETTAVRVLAFMNISYMGLIGMNYDEYCNVDACDVDLFERVANRHRDVVVGVKTRMGTGRIGNQGLEPLRRSLRAAERCGLPVMVHIAEAPPPVDEVLALMRPGDILTHAFTGLSERLIDENGHVGSAAWRAKEAGVVFDVGHGSGSFSFRSAEALTAAGIWPDIISTDLHQVSLAGPDLLEPHAQELVARVRGDGSPKFTMLTAMSKFLHLGMDLYEVIAATTCNPARLMGMEDEIGTLRVGARADVALLRLSTGTFTLTDVHGETRLANQLLEHACTVVGGRRMDPLPLPSLPPWIKLIDGEPGLSTK